MSNTKAASNDQFLAFRAHMDKDLKDAVEANLDRFFSSVVLNLADADHGMRTGNTLARDNSMRHAAELLYGKFHEKTKTICMVFCTTIED